MASTAELQGKIKVCMFDQYGTVVDMQTGLTEVATPFLKRKGWEGSPYAFVTWWRRTHFENSMIDALLQKEHTSYREIGHQSVAWVLERAGIPYTMDEVRYLVAQIEQLRPFPDVPEALARL
jgi:2-haloacid dehalogenase